MTKLFFLVHDFRVNHAVVLFLFFGLRLATFGLRLRTGFIGLRLRGSGLVKFRAHGLRRFVQLLAGGLDGGGVAALERFLRGGNRGLELGLVVRRNFLGVVLDFRVFRVSFSGLAELVLGDGDLRDCVCALHD